MRNEGQLIASSSASRTKLRRQSASASPPLPTSPVHLQPSVSVADSTATASSDLSEEPSELPEPLDGPIDSAHPIKELAHYQRIQSLTTLQRNILKCAISYFIASLFTFIPYLAGFISHVDKGPSPSGHLIATV
jgi:hypothetical protein